MVKLCSDCLIYIISFNNLKIVMIYKKDIDITNFSNNKLKYLYSKFKSILRYIFII